MWSAHPGQQGGEEEITIGKRPEEEKKKRTSAEHQFVVLIRDHSSDQEFYGLNARRRDATLRGMAGTPRSLVPSSQQQQDRRISAHNEAHPILGRFTPGGPRTKIEEEHCTFLHLNSGVNFCATYIVSFMGHRKSTEVDEEGAKKQSSLKRATPEFILCRLLSQ
jgi:hypothetical protein